MDPTAYEVVHELEQSHWFFVARRRILSRLLDDLLVGIDQPKILDVGCGTGHLLLSIRDNYSPSSLTGFDMVPPALEIARETVPNADIHYGDLLEYDGQRSFDVVFCTEVLEHIVEADQALMKLVNMTNKSGVCFVAVPNGRDDYFAGHVNFWSPESWDYFIKSNCNDCDIETGIWFNRKKNFAIIRPH